MHEVHGSHGSSVLTALDVKFLGRDRVIAAGLLDGGRRGVALVDPGPTTSLPGLRAALAAEGRELRDVDDVLLTHIHLDHAGATGTIVREHPRVRVHVHELGAPHMLDPSRLLNSAARLYGADMARLWGDVVPVPEGNLHLLAGGETIPAAGRDLRVAYTPGHASHHVSYFDPETRTAFVGDTAGVRVGTCVLPPTPPPDIDLDAWDTSVEAILAWEPETLFLTHFGPFADPVAHFAAFRGSLEQLITLASALLTDRSLDDEGRMAAFAAGLRQRIEAQAGAEAADACARAILFEHCWLGLSRCLRRQAGG